jgi:hypothetical protein
MKNDKPNAAEERWREAVRELGSCVTGAPALIHHCVGRTAKHNKVEIGHWWILPLTEREHAWIHAHPNRKETERQLFEQTLRDYEAMHSEGPPVPDDVLQAIRDWHR